MFEEACEGWVVSAVLEVGDDSSADGCVLDHLVDIVWVVYRVEVNSDVSYNADFVFVVVGCICCFDGFDGGEEVRSVGFGHGVVWY